MASNFSDPTPDGAESAGDRAWLTAIVTVTFFLASYVSAVLLHEIVGGRGLPAIPFLYLVILIPVSALVVRYEDDVRAREDWPRLKKFWNGGFFVIAGLVPIVLTLWKPLAFATGLPRGGATVAAFIGAGVLVVVLVALASRILRRP